MMAAPVDAASGGVVPRPESVGVHGTPGTGLARGLVSLAKPRVTSLVVFTGLGGVWLAPLPVSVWATVFMLLGTTLLVGSANAFNCLMERDGDARMPRTALRPLPTGAVRPWQAAAWALGLLAASLPLLWVWGGPTVTALGALAHLSYVLIYTPMKRRSAWAVVVGAVPGAMPPLMGYVTVTGTLDVGGAVVFLLLWTWQLVHTLAIGIFRESEYTAAGILVVPARLGRRLTGLIMALATLPLFGLVWAAQQVGLVGVPGAVCGSLVTLWFSARVWQGAAQGDPVWARGVFFASMPYLPALFAVLSLHRLFPAW